MRSPRIIIEELAEAAAVRGFLNSGRVLDLDDPKNKPGYTIMNLPDGVRERLKELKSDDIKGHCVFRKEFFS